MRGWRLGRSARAAGGLAAEPSPAIQAALRAGVDDLFAIESEGARGAGVIFSGELRLPVARALPLLQARLRPLGYTPFLAREHGRTWLHALPFVDGADPGRPGVNLVLFLLTLVSTLAAGAFVAGAVPWLTFDPAREPGRLLAGLPFAVTLLAILGTHEFGHYFTARWHGAAVSLPYFIPAPPPLFLFGTLGAVIRMRSPARDRNALLDIAAAGPLAGLAVALPAMWLGLAWSTIARVPESGAVAFGDSLLMRGMVYLVLGPVPPGMDVFVHPVALAGWVGFFVTALNLFPVGQLDGGRIAYALAGAHHRRISVGTAVGLAVLSAVTGSPNWLVFAALVTVLMGLHHVPPLDDLTPLSAGRRALGLFCFVLLVVLIPPVPIQVG
jgi:membrane-associated protease RseP (regulator of RpoE activity)